MREKTPRCNISRLIKISMNVQAVSQLLLANGRTSRNVMSFLHLIFRNASKNVPLFCIFNGVISVSAQILLLQAMIIKYPYYTH
jgi:hypothetical protein